MSGSDPSPTDTDDQGTIAYLEMDVDSDVEAIQRAIDELDSRVDEEFINVSIQIGVPEEHRSDLEAYAEDIGSEYEYRLWDERKEDGSSGRPGSR